MDFAKTAGASLVQLVLDVNGEGTGRFGIFFGIDDATLKRVPAVRAEWFDGSQFAIAMAAAGQVLSEISGQLRMQCCAHGLVAFRCLSHCRSSR